MDLARPIGAVVPTLDGPVLEALARTTRPLTGREVHRLSRSGSEAGVRRVLNRLAEHGVVHATKAGQAVLYTANRDHLVWPAIEALARTRETLLERLRAELRSWSIKPTTVALFGSAARGDGTVTSDIDLLVVRPADIGEGTHGHDRWLQQVDGLRESVTSWTGNHCQIYELDRDDVTAHVRRGEPILAEWKRDASLLYGEPISRLVDAVTNTRRR